MLIFGLSSVLSGREDLALRANICYPLFLAGKNWLSSVHAGKISVKC